MRTLLLADIHANWQALNAVHQAEPDFDACFVLGDLVDYGVDGPAVIEWVQKYATFVIRGNHDHAVSQLVLPRSAGTPLKQLRNETRAIHWKTLGEDAMTYLAELPLRKRVMCDGLACELLHATPRDCMNEYLPAHSTAWEEQLAACRVDLLCVGHTHRPFVQSAAGKRVVNPGSVGQPRDGHPGASYAILEDGELELKRISYPIEETLTAMRNAGLSEGSLTFARYMLQNGLTA
ncbi:metallophosphoesterase family protein [bacterium]|uniref:metallophosphoesterase family protein n=1 Tax=Rubinisphaera sp. JC750 TaxID=2898658 RepID=UPI001F3052FC|nr:metallophosphoesterase family protein [Rubinisphaera sp. JC750]MBR9804608.1 metallophosphoesterase family protein [bacterium]